MGNPDSYLLGPGDRFAKPDEKHDGKGCIGCFDTYGIVTLPVNSSWGSPRAILNDTTHPWHLLPMCDSCREVIDDADRAAYADAESDGLDGASDYE